MFSFDIHVNEKKENPIEIQYKKNLLGTRQRVRVERHAKIDGVHNPYVWTMNIS